MREIIRFTFIMGVYLFLLFPFTFVNKSVYIYLPIYYCIGALVILLFLDRIVKWILKSCS